MMNPQTGEPITGRRTRRSCLRSGNQSGDDPEPDNPRDLVNIVGPSYFTNTADLVKM